MAQTFLGRGDKPNAGNSELNVQGTNKFPTTSITFNSTVGGNDEPNFNDGNPDANTTVTVNGTTYDFIVEFTGTFPQNNSKVNNAGGEDLGGEEIMVITLVGPGADSGQRIFFLTDPDVPITTSVMDGIGNGAIPIQQLVFDCFVAGAHIRTPDGATPVENLTIGDLVLTADGKAVPLTWVGHATEAVSRAQSPIGIPAAIYGALDDSSILWVSPLHRVRIVDAALERLFAVPQALVQARDLPRTIPWTGGAVHYVHLLCDGHQCVEANGIWAETLFPPRAKATRLTSENPMILEEGSGHAGDDQFCLPALTRKEAALWRRETRLFPSQLVAG